MQLKPTRQPWGRMALGALSGAGFTAFFSTDWCCTTVGGGLLAFFGTWIVEFLMDRPWRPRWHVRRRARALIAVVVGLIVGLGLRLDKPANFEQVFGTPLPVTVRDLHISRNKGLPGDVIILLRFTADAATIERLIGVRPVQLDAEAINLYPPDRNWNSFVRFVFSNFSEIVVDRGWRQIAPMKNPRLYKWESRGPRPKDVRLLWDADTGRAYALYIG